MSMVFRAIKAALINNILGPAEAGRFKTVGFQRQVKSAEETLDNSRLVQVYYSSGNFPKSSGRLNGPVQHDISFSVDLTVSAAAAGDLATINNISSTPVQVAAALLAFQEAAGRADDLLDDLFDIVYQILMDARNQDLGLPSGTVANRWVDQLNKDDPVPSGEYVILTGNMRLTCRAAEEVPGDIGVVGDKTFDFNIELENDDVQKSGKAGKLGGV